MSPEDWIGVCTECKSEMSDKYMRNNPFARSGDNPACKYCGGVVVVGQRKNKPGTKRPIGRRDEQ